jgi:hopanoid biosynthesis associated protein HpnK
LNFELRALNSLLPIRRLVVNADDFGRSPDINAAVREAHTTGILTTASLMVNEPAAAEAIPIARTHPTLGVGLHLTLLCGQAASPSPIAPSGRFSDRPAPTGWRYFFRRSLREDLRREIAAQFDRFARTGLDLDHVNGHLNIHLHPTALDLLFERCRASPPIPPIRLTRDPFFLNARIAAGRWAYRVSHAVIFNLLSWHARSRLRRHRVPHTQRVFGLLQNAQVTAEYLLDLLPSLPPGDSELYCHPSLTDFRHELNALTHPAVQTAVRQLGIQLVRYRDL